MPVSTFGMRSRHNSINFSYNSLAASGEPACTKLGRFPLRQSAYNVNWLTMSSSPPTSVIERLVLPFSSAKIRNFTILSTNFGCFYKKWRNSFS